MMYITNSWAEVFLRSWLLLNWSRHFYNFVEAESTFLVHKSQPLIPTLSQMNPVLISVIFFENMLWHYPLIYAWFTKCSLSFRFSYKNYIYFVSYAYEIPHGLTVRHLITMRLLMKNQLQSATWCFVWTLGDKGDNFTLTWLLNSRIFYPPRIIVITSKRKM
jgi:hypothetical protein